MSLLKNAKILHRSDNFLVRKFALFIFLVVLVVLLGNF